MVTINAFKDTELFQPITVGKVELSNRVVFAPTTRMRALADHTPSDLQLQHYDDRTKTAGSLVITEATIASEKFGVYDNVPGIFNEKQADAWKAIVDKVHANGSRISIQLWALGRVADPKATKKAGHHLIGPLAIYSDAASKVAAEEAGNPLRLLTEEEVHDFIYKEYDNAARMAKRAGFDFVEVHGANGYLVDQFLHSETNKRTDQYGGSIENRARFALDVVDHVASIVGYEKTAIRLSPWNRFGGMDAEDGAVSPVAQFGYLLSELEQRRRKGKAIAYVSLVEPRVFGNADAAEVPQVHNDFVRSVYKGPLIRAGNYLHDAPLFDTLTKDISDGNTLIAFSRYFTSNPDLVQRLRDGTELRPYERDLFYANNNWGYNTYLPLSEDRIFDKEAEQLRVALPIP